MRTSTTGSPAPSEEAAVFGKLFGKMLSQVRKLNGNGPPGADAATHRKRSAVRGADAVVSMVTAGADSDADGDAPGRGITYPEWDVHRRRYRPDWCTVQVTDAKPGDQSWSAPPDGHALRRALTRLGMGLDRVHRQQHGDDIDIDAAVEARVELVAGSAPDDAVYVDSLRRRRDLSVLLLLDVSGSAAEAGTGGKTVHEQQRWVAAALTAALHELGDRVALYAFRSQGRSDVSTHWRSSASTSDTTPPCCVGCTGSKPGAYSRLGAAIRHGTEVLRDRAAARRVDCSSCSPTDSPTTTATSASYGAADARKALVEARRQGTRVPVPDRRGGHRRRGVAPGVRQRCPRHGAQAPTTEPRHRARCSGRRSIAPTCDVGQPL